MDFAQRLSRCLDIDEEQTVLLFEGSKENVGVTKSEYIQSGLNANNYVTKAVSHLKPMVPSAAKDVLKTGLGRPQIFELSEEWKQKIRMYARDENTDPSDLLNWMLDSMIIFE